MRQQREIIYAERRFILTQESIEEHAINMVTRGVTNDIYRFVNDDRSQTINKEAVLKHYDGNIFQKGAIKEEDLENVNDVNDLTSLVIKKAQAEIQYKEHVPPVVFKSF